MTFELLALLAATPILVLACHVVASRALPRWPPQLVAMLAVLAASIPMGGLLWRFGLAELTEGPELVTTIVYVTATYGALAYTYFHFFNMSETARRIRILCAIHRAGSLGPDELTGIYRAPDIVALRLQRLVALRQLKCEAGRYTLDRKLLYRAARIVLAWRGLLGFRADEHP